MLYCLTIRFIDQFIHNIDNKISEENYMFALL